MRNVLLIASASESYYFDPFLKANNRENLRLYLFDPSRFPSEATISLGLGNDGNLSGFVDVLDLKSDPWEEARLAVQDIDVAWYLREGPPGSATTGGSLEERFTRNEARGAIWSFLSTLSCRWINRFETIEFLSSNKLYQQQAATRAGLAVPVTLMSNHPESVIGFSSRMGGLLLKSIGYTKLDEAGECSLYSQRVPHEEVKESSLAIRGCPVFAQEYMGKRYEHRVMVIGERVLSCRIDSQTSEMMKVDWRHYDFEHVEHVGVELPHEVQEKLRQFMQRIGLRYGALDLIETPAGEFVFLEVNPSGQWGWIADFAGLPIPEAVIEMLATA